MSSNAIDTELLEARAKAMCIAADGVEDPKIKTVMLRLADEYEQLAKQARERLSREL